MGSKSKKGKNMNGVTFDLINKIINSSDPLEPIWKHLKKIWKPEGKIKDFESFYRKGDLKTKELEDLLEGSFLELYIHILPTRCKRKPEINSPALLLDGLSIRESFILIDDLKKEGYEASLKGHSFSSVPSDTSSFRDKIKMSKYTIVKNEDGITPTLSEKLWCKLPDKEREDIEVKQAPAFREIYEKTLNICLKIINRMNVDELSITSDHGYVDAKRAEKVGRRNGVNFREVFGDSRTISDSEIKIDENTEKIYCTNEGYYCMIGWSAPVRRFGSSRRFLHGGISLVECITPVIEVKT